MPLEHYFLKSLPYGVTLESGWWSVETFRDTCNPFPSDPLLRMLLLSDGSLVRNLSACFLGPVHFEVIRQREILLDHTLSKFLQLPPGGVALSRDVWLAWDRGQGMERVVYAHAVVDCTQISSVLLQGLRKQKQPVGLLLEEVGVPVQRDQIHIGRLKSPELADAIPSQTTTFWGRIYRLRTEETFRAAILEVFTSEKL